MKKETKKEKIIAYKVFDSELKCKNMQFAIGKKATIKGDLILCENGIHFCRKLINCFNYYSFDPKNRVCEVEILGDVKGDPENKECTNIILLIRELKWDEVLGLVNTGVGNSGDGNSGDRNWSF